MQTPEGKLAVVQLDNGAITIDKEGEIDHNFGMNPFLFEMYKYFLHCAHQYAQIGAVVVGATFLLLYW